MLLLRSPSLIFAFTFSIFSILLAILTFPYASQHSHDYLQFLIILPPLNSIFLFLFSLTWIERRFRLTYIPFLCLIILVLSSIILTIISFLFLSIHSYIILINFCFYFFSTLLFTFMILILIFFYVYGFVSIYFSRNLNTKIERISFQSTDNEFILFTSSITIEHICTQTESFLNELSQLNIDTILTLNELKEFRNRNSTRKTRQILDNYSMNIKRAHMQHLIYSIREHFIPKSISDYIQFLYIIIINISRSNQTHLFVHSMGSLGRNQMIIISLDLFYDYLIKKNQREKFFERIFHYPFRLTRFCRVCQSITNIQTLTNHCDLNPVQIYFLHEFYARLKTSTYMEQIRQIIDNNEKLLLNTFDDLQLPINV